MNDSEIAFLLRVYEEVLKSIITYPSLISSPLDFGTCDTSVLPSTLSYYWIV